MKTKSIKIMFLSGLILTGLLSLAPAIEKKSDLIRNANGNTDILTSALNNFAFGFFSEVNREDFGKNIFISPLSATLALAMVYNGADGGTKKAIEKALRWNDLDESSINEYLGWLSRHLGEIDPKIELNIANSIWAKSNLKFKQEFFDVVIKYFKAELNPLTDAETINKWVEDKTRGKIKKIIGRITPYDIMILINAIYFKGTWTYEFDPKMTQERDFTLLNGSKKKHPLMSQSGDFMYYETDDFQAISLPYGNKKLSMYVFLPAEEHGLKVFLDNINSENWSEWMSHFHMREGRIVLPRFKLEYEKTLNDILAEMGMGIAFDPVRADFSGMYEGSPDSNVYISQVKQKTFVEVNEEGTEAAAVTSITMTLTDAVEIPQRRFEMTVDRPFFCAICDNETGAILFMGAIVNPE